MKKHRLWYGMTVAASFAIYIIANRWEALVFLAVLIMMPIILGLIQILAMNGLEMEYILGTGCTVRNKIPLTLKIKKNNSLPIGPVHLQISIHNLMFQEEAEHQIILQSSGKKELEFQYMIKMEDCGSVRTTVQSVEFFDLTGLLCIFQKQEQIMETLVYPAEIPLVAKLERRPETTTFGDFYDQNRKGQDVSEVSGLRDYAEGDSLGSIHWKLSGKLDQLVVREFGYPSNYQVLILYDMMKEYSGQKIANQRNNAVLALTSALSYSMVELNLEHNVGRVTDGEFHSIPVYSRATHEQMLVNLICRPVSENNEKGDAVYHFLRQDLKKEFTKIIYITPEYEESAVRQLSRDADITVVKVVQGTDGSFVDTPGYAVIPVDAEHYREKVHSIVI